LRALLMAAIPCMLEGRSLALSWVERRAVRRSA
jgi:hypothetical protein